MIPTIFRRRPEGVAVRGMQGQEMPPKIYDSVPEGTTPRRADKGYCSQDNRDFLSMNEIADGIMAPPRRGHNYYVYALKSSLSQRIYFGQTVTYCQKDNDT